MTTEKRRTTITTCTRPTKRRRRTVTKGRLDFQKWLGKTRIEFHWPGYQHMGPATHLANRFKRGDLGINLDLGGFSGNGPPVFWPAVWWGGGRVVVRDIQSGNALSWGLSSRETSSRQCEANPWLGNSLALNWRKRRKWTYKKLLTPAYLRKLTWLQRNLRLKG